MFKIGIDMHLPEGKIPGYYAQVIKGLAGRVILFDRDKETLVVSTEDERAAVLDVLRHFNVEAEEIPLLLLPVGSEVTPLFEDYGFESRSENRFLFSDRVITVSLSPGSGPDAAAALQQLDEYIIARYPSDDAERLIFDRDHQELVERIARAYNCEIVVI